MRLWRPSRQPVFGDCMFPAAQMNTVFAIKQFRALNHRTGFGNGLINDRRFCGSGERARPRARFSAPSRKTRTHRKGS